jgi:transposase
VEAACWAHARRKFFDLAQINNAPIAIEAVEHIDVLFRGFTPRSPHSGAPEHLHFHRRSSPYVSRIAIE